MGKQGDGFHQMLQTLDGGRLSIAAMGLGGAQGAYELALKYARSREQFGQPISKFQAVAFKLADCAMELECGRNHRHRYPTAGCAMESGTRVPTAGGAKPQSAYRRLSRELYLRWREAGASTAVRPGRSGAGVGPPVSPRALKAGWWKLPAGALALVALFLLVDISFFSANVTKITHGAWFPLAIGAVFFTVYLRFINVRGFRHSIDVVRGVVAGADRVAVAGIRHQHHAELVVVQPSVCHGAPKNLGDRLAVGVGAAHVPRVGDGRLEALTAPNGRVHR